LRVSAKFKSRRGFAGIIAMAQKFIVCV
jgi:hypothetical protein